MVWTVPDIPETVLPTPTTFKGKYALTWLRLVASTKPSLVIWGNAKSRVDEGLGKLIFTGALPGPSPTMTAVPVPAEPVRLPMNATRPASLIETLP